MTRLPLEVPYLDGYDKVAVSDITQILADFEQGDPHAAEQLLPLVYAELRQLAAKRLAAENPGQTLDPTSLVHEAYLRLVPNRTHASLGEQHWDGRGHFFAAAAEAMRRILVENARRKARLKHGGNRVRVALTDRVAEDDEDRLLALDEALSRLAAEDPQAAQVVELHHFAGLSHELVAQALGLSIYRVRQIWGYARAWLHDALAQ